MNQQLIQKAGNLFLRYGIRSVSMDDLARELGVSKKTLYQQVENKTDLVREVLNSRNEEENLAIVQLTKESNNAIEEMVLIARYMIARLRLLSPSFRYDLKKYYREVFKEMEDFHQKHFLEYAEINLEKGKQEGLYRQNINVNVIARLFIIMTNNIGHDQFFSIDKFPLDDLFQHSFLYHLHGITSAKGRDVMCEYIGEESEECL